VNKRKIRGGIDLFQSFSECPGFSDKRKNILVLQKGILTDSFCRTNLRREKEQKFSTKKNKDEKSIFSKFKEVTIRDKQSTAGGTDDETGLIEYVEFTYGTSGLDNPGIQRASLFTR